jgi:hypothetical protein
VEDARKDANNDDMKSVVGKRTGLRTKSDFAIVRPGGDMGLAPEYIVVDGQTLNKTKLSLDNHVYKNCSIDDCDIYYSGGQYELIDTHVTNSRLILNHPAKGIYAAIQIFKMKSPGSRIIAE